MHARLADKPSLADNLAEQTESLRFFNRLMEMLDRMMVDGEWDWVVLENIHVQTDSISITL